MAAVAISASGPPSVALRVDSGAILRSEEPGSTAGSSLADEVARLFAGAGLDPRDLREIRLDLGPGSYTGLRVAVTFARVAMRFFGASVCTTTSLEATALAAWDAGVDPARTVRPIFDARRHRFHHASIRLDGGTHVLEEPSAVPFDALRAAIRAGEVLAAEPAVLDRFTAIAGIDLLPAPAWDAALLFDPRLRCRAATAEELEPLYLMGSYAEGA